MKDQLRAKNEKFITVLKSHGITERYNVLGFHLSILSHYSVKIFADWIALHKCSETTQWRWLGLKCNFEECWNQTLLDIPQRQPELWADVHIPNGMSLPANVIKQQFNEPSAVVLQEKELDILMDEFLDFWQ